MTDFDKHLKFTVDGCQSTSHELEKISFNSLRKCNIKSANGRCVQKNCILNFWPLMLKIAFVYLLLNCLFGCALSSTTLPDFSKMVTPPSFVHKPNDDAIFFVVEQSGPSSTNTSESGSGLNLRERRFRCKASGVPDVTYRWLKNGYDFNLKNPLLAGRISTASDEGSIVISRLSSDDQGTYQCIAKNENGTAIDKPIQFIKTFINLLPVHHEAFDVEFGEPFTKECLPPRSVPNARAYWILMSGQTAERRLFQTINFTNIAINDKGQIFFQYVRDEDNIPGFYYTCMAENVELKDYKFGFQFNFNVIHKPDGRQSLEPYVLPREQFFSPREITVLQGDSLELFCIVSGYPNYIPEWGRHHGKIDYTRVSWNTNFKKSIKIDNVDSRDEDTYFCKFDNSRFDKKFTVIVDAAPHWLEEPPKSINSSEGSDVEFFCNAQGRPQPEFKFYKNGNEIKHGGRYAIDGPQLKITNIRKSSLGSGDSAVYQCNATNKHGSLWTNFYLNILAFPPIILSDPSDVVTVEGKTASFSCKTFGSPMPSVKWAGPALSGTENVNFNQSSKPDQHGLARLNLFNVSKNKAGLYTCTFSNIYDKVSASSYLIVRDATKIIPLQPISESNVGTPLEVACGAQSDPNHHLTYMWLFDGRPVTPSPGIMTLVQTNHTTLLQLHSPTGVNSGNYTCVAETEFDSVSSSTIILIKDVPLPPISLVVNCSMMGAELSFYYVENPAVEAHPSAGLAASGWIVQYTVDPDEPDAWENYVTELTWLDSGYGQMHVALFPYGKFAFRVLARNSVGSSAPAYPGDVQNGVNGRCETPPQPPIQNPAQVHIQGNTENSLIVNWEPLPRRDWYGPKFSYVVEYKPTSANDSTPFKNLTVDDPFRDTVIISDVPTYVEYDVTVSARNQLGMAEVRPFVSTGRSGESEPSEAPKNFRRANIEGPSTVTLAWDAVDPSSINGEFRGYKIKHWVPVGKSKRSIDEGNSKEAYFDSKSSIGTVYDFKANTINHAVIMVYNNFGDGPVSSVLHVEMPEGVPSPVQAVSVFPISQEEIGAIWSAPSEINGNFSGYEIKVCQLQENHILESTCKSKSIAADGPSEARMKGLNSSVPYRVEIRAKTNAGLGDPSSFDTRTTKIFDQSAPPSTPTIEKVELGHDHINVTWKPGNFSSASQSPPGDKFYLQYKAKDEDKWTTINDTSSATGLTMSLGGLRPSTVYEVRSVSQHGNLSTPSRSHFYTTTGGPNKTSASGWLIALLVAIIILSVLLLLICLVVRSRGAKYPVSQKEKEQGREPMLKNERGFGEYSLPNVDEERKSLTAESLKATSETDSMAEYGDGETGRFTEDGSFIGQYGVAMNKSGQDKSKKQPSTSTFV